MKIDFCEETGSIYIQLKDVIEGGECVRQEVIESRDKNQTVVVDFNEDGEILGVEILR